MNASATSGPLGRIVAALGLMALLCSCPQTEVDADFGEAAALLKSADWAGTWEVLGEDEQGRMEVNNASAGELSFVGLDQAGKPKEKPSRLRLRLVPASKKQASGAEVFFALMSEVEKGRERFTPYLMRLQPGRLLLWNLRHEAVSDAIRGGVLRGRLTRIKDGDEHSWLESCSANSRELTDPKYWDWMEPVILRRLPPAR